MVLTAALSLRSWKCLGESLLAMYNHLTTCEPPRPSLGRRVDLSDYQDLSQHPVSAAVAAPVSVAQPSPVNAGSSVTVAEPVLSCSPVATASFPLHSPSLLEPGVPLGEPPPSPPALASGETQFAGQEGSGLFGSLRGTGPAHPPGLRFKQEAPDPRGVSPPALGAAPQGPPPQGPLQ